MGGLNLMYLTVHYRKESTCCKISLVVKAPHHIRFQYLRPVALKDLSALVNQMTMEHL